MTGLPAQLTEPLHILEPWPWREVVVGAVIVGATFWLLWHWPRSSKKEEAPEPLEPELSPFARSVERIRLKAHESSGFRIGCHELAELLRRRVLARHGDRFAYLTSREIAVQLGESSLTELLVDLADVRFGRRPPTGKRLDGLCERSLELYGGGR